MRIINRHKDEKKITSRAELFGTFIETSTEGFYIFDEKLFSIEMNAAALRLSQVDHSKTVGSNIKELLPNMDANRYDALRNVIRTSNPLRYRDYIFDADGHSRLYEIAAFKLGAGLGVVVFDVSQARERAASQSVSEELSDAILSQLHEPFLILDSSNRILGSNRGFLDHFKMKSSDILEESIYDIGDKQFNVADLHELLDHKIAHAGTAKNFNISGYFKTLGARTLNINARQFYNTAESHLLTLLAFNDISESIRHKTALKKLSDIFFLSPDPIVLTDLKGEIIDLNDEALKLYGWPRSEMLKKSFKTIIPPDARSAYDSLLETVVAAETVRDLETEHWSKKGEILPINLTITLIKDPQDEPVGTVSYIKHIASRSRAEKAMSRLYQILLQSNDPVIILDLNGTITDLNQAAEHTYGWTKATISGKPGHILVQPSDHGIHDTAMLDCISGKTVKDRSMRRVTKQGVVRNADVSYHLLTDAQNQSDGIAVVAKHTSALEKAERSHQQLLNSFLEIDDPVVVENLAGEVVDLNKAAVVKYGWKKSDIVGKLAKSLVPVDQQQQAAELVKRCRSGELIKNFASKRWSKSGVFFNVSLTMFLVVDAEEVPEYVVTISRHVDEDAASARGTDHMEDIFHHAVDPIVLEDNAGNVTNMNLAAEKLFGWTKRDLMGKPMKTIIPADQHKQHEKILLLCQNNVEIRKVESKRWSKTGHVYPVHVSLIPVRGEGDKIVGIANITQDITEMLKLRKWKQDIEKQLGR